MRYRFIAALVMSAIVSCAAGAEKGKGWLQLDLKKTHADSAVVYFDPVFENKLEVIRKALKEFPAGIESSSPLLSQREAVIKDINTILGQTGLDTELQVKAFESFIGAFKDIRQITFYVVSAETTKDFLRRGGRLPDCTYNKETDTCTYNPEFEKKIDSGPISSFEFAIPLSEKKDFTRQLASFMQSLQYIDVSMMTEIAIHEVTEMTLQKRIRARNPHLRWFTDGTAHAVTYEILKKHVSGQSAEAFLSSLDISPYENLTSQINLRYWMLLKYCLPRGANQEIDELEFPRYCFAAHEMRLLIDKHGLGCVKKIIDEFCSEKARNGDQLLRIIEKVTGEDMNKRLNRYQTFETRSEGMKKYSAKVQQAKKNKDSGAFISNALRLLEMYETPFNIDSLMTRKMIAATLSRTGQHKIADETMNNCVEMLSGTSAEKAEQIGRQLYISYAIESSRPEIAIDHANQMLEIMPDFKPALLVKMITLSKDGKVNQAKQYARKIQTLTRPGNQFYDMADGLLEKAENANE